MGKGPYTYVASIELVEADYQLPKHYIYSRSIESNTNPVYKIKFNYNFYLIKRAKPVNMQVNFTNLLKY